MSSQTWSNTHNDSHNWRLSLTRRAALFAGIAIGTVALGSTLPSIAGRIKGEFGVPAIVYVDQWGAMGVASADGRSKAELLRLDSMLTRPAWSPRGDGSEGNPYSIIFESPICSLNRLSFFIPSGGQPIVQALQTVSTNAPSGCAPEFSPSGTEIVFGAGEHGLWLMNEDQTNQRQVHPAQQDWRVTFATFSPDASQIAFIESRSNPYAANIKILTLNPDRTGGSAYELFNGAQSGFERGLRFLEWKRGSRTLAFAGWYLSSSEGIFTLEVPQPGQTVSSVTVTGLVAKGSMPSWSVGGQQLAFTDPAKGVSVLDLQSGTTSVIVRGGHHSKFRRH